MKNGVKLANYRPVCKTQTREVVDSNFFFDLIWLIPVTSKNKLNNITLFLRYKIAETRNRPFLNLGSDIQNLRKGIQTNDSVPAFAKDDEADNLNSWLCLYAFS